MITKEPVFKKQNIMQQSGRTKLSSNAIYVLAAEKKYTDLCKSNSTQLLESKHYIKVF